MLLDIAYRLKKLFEDIAAEGNAPDAPDADETGMIGAKGEPGGLELPFEALRQALPVLGMLTPRQRGIAMSPEEVAAWEMLCQHRISHASMLGSDELEDYLALGISPELENRWRAVYEGALLDHYEAQPEGLNEALLMAAEYVEQPLMARVLEALDDAVSAERMPGEVVLDGCRNALITLDTGRFDPAFTEEARSQLMEIAGRAEYHLSRYDPEGPWRAVLADIRTRAGT